MADDDEETKGGASLKDAASADRTGMRKQNDILESAQRQEANAKAEAVKARRKKIYDNPASRRND